MDIRDFEHLIDENTKVILARDGAKVMVLGADTKIILETVTDDRIKRLSTQLYNRLTPRSYVLLLRTIIQNLSNAQVATYFHTTSSLVIKDTDKTKKEMELAFTKIVDLIFTYFYQTTISGNGIENLIDSIIESHERS